MGRRRTDTPTEWCVVPNTAQASANGEVGVIMECETCQHKYDTVCSSTNDCYGPAGCNYMMPSGTNRDDLVKTGFIPCDFKGPLKVTIHSISGEDYAPSSICPSGSGDWVPSFKPDLFLTLTPQDYVGEHPKNEAGGCKRNTGFDCISGSAASCGDEEECQMFDEVDKCGQVLMCACKSGFCLEGTAGEADAVCHNPSAVKAG